MELSKRKQNILALIVKGYVETGVPVGSKWIADAVGGVSPATVRNEMAELAQLGFLEQPHTSAGRVPSALGWREYVDHVMTAQELSNEERFEIREALTDAAVEPERLLRGAAETLARVSGCLAVCTMPTGSGAKVSGVQFVQTGRRTAMLLLMTSAGGLRQKLFRCDFDLSREITHIFFRVLNEKVSGHPVSEINRAFVQKIAVSTDNFGVLLTPALMALLQAAQDAQRVEAAISGQMNLLQFPEYRLGGVRRLLKFMEQAEAVTAMLSGGKGKPRIRIGTENGVSELAESSVVSARYFVGQEDMGAVAVVGPMRMDYARMAARVAFASECVGMLLTALYQEE